MTPKKQPVSSRTYRRHGRLYAMIGLLLVIGTIAGGMKVYAAFTAREEKQKVMQIGVVETTVKDVIDTPVTTAVNEPVATHVTLKNDGTIPQFIRVMIHPSLSYRVKDQVRLLPSGVGKDVHIETSSTDWLQGEDGYYYYLHAVEPGKETSAVMDQISVSKGKGEEYYLDLSGATFTVTIKSEAIQATKQVYTEAWWGGVSPSEEKLGRINQQLTQEALE